MLPPGIEPLAQIESAHAPETQIQKLVSLLGYLLNLINPNVAPRENRKAGAGDRVDANRHLFSRVDDLFFALKIRNCIVHPEDCERPPGAAEINRAIKHLRNGLNEIRDHYRIPADVRAAIFRSAARPQSSANQQDSAQQHRAQASAAPPPPPPNFSHINQAAPINSPPPAPARRPLQMPRHWGRWVALLIAGVLLVAYGSSLWQFGVERVYGSKALAEVRKREADAAVKRLEKLDQAQGFAPKIIEAQGAWRDANTLFKQEQYKSAEAGYQRVLQISDEVIVMQQARAEAQSLLAEVKTGRAAARAANASKLATQIWQEAETARNAADAALTNGNFAEAKQQALLAKQKFQEAISAAEQTPSPTPTMDVATDGPSDPPPATNGPTVRPREPEPTEQPTTTTPRRRDFPPPPAVDPEPARNADDDVFPIDQREFMRYVKKKVDPVLPDAARAQGISGPVTIEVFLSPYGHMSKAHVVSGNPQLRQAALDALRQWQFRPYLQDRVPIAVRSEITVYVR